MLELIAEFEERAAVAEASAARWRALHGEWARSSATARGHEGEARAWRSAAALVREQLKEKT